MNLKAKWDEWISWGTKRFDLTPVEAKICATGVVILGLSTLFLIALNMDAILLALFLALSLGFAILSFISGVALLQEEIILMMTPLSIPFDMDAGNLPSLSSDTTATNSLTHPPLEALTNLAQASPPPSTLIQKQLKKRRHTVRLKKEVILTSCGELLQYEVFRLLYALQKGLWLSSKPRHKPEPGLHPSADPEHSDAQAEEDPDVDTLPKTLGGYPPLSKMYQYQGEPLWNVVSVNRFSVVDAEQRFWSQAHLFLPENTRVTLNYVVASSDANNLGYNVQLVKPWFFEIRFTIAPTVPTDWHVPPASVKLSDEESMVTVKYTVRMTAHFHRITAGHHNTAELKGWARWLFSRMKQLIKDRDFERWMEQEQRRRVSKKKWEAIMAARSEAEPGSGGTPPHEATPPPSKRDTAGQTLAQPAPSA